MPIYSPTGNLDITNATLRTSNIETQNIKISNIAISAAHNLQQVTSIGNATTNTIEFNNSTTSLTTASNVTVGNNLTVSGNIISNQETTLTGNVTVGKNILLSSNTTTRVDSNVVVEHFGPHKRHPITPVLKKFPDVDFTQGKFDYNDSTRTYAQAGYVVSASSQISGSEVWRLFDDGEWDQEAIDKYTSASSFQYNPTSNPNALGGVDGEWFKVEFPRKVIIDKFILNVGDLVNPGPQAFKVLGSDDDTDWQVVKEVSGLTTASYSTSAPYTTTVESVSSTAFRYYAVVITQLLAATRVSIREVEFYGYEEDPPAGDTSIDTTFTSVMNTPQTGGVQVYVDGPTLENKITTGPTPTSTGATYDSTGKYWSITSNISVEANTFMSGDQPHAVSVWFNSSNLEANVSNTCVFSVSDQEKLDSQNLDLQSNTWHNLTYAYQGEGGSRVTYLDGRKVSEDQAEDTFGDYPPFAMTGYSQGGYVVSASDEKLDGTRPAWQAFNKSLAGGFSAWGTDGGFTSGVYSSGGSSFTLNGSSQSGHWLKIELPHKLHVSYVEIIENNNTSFKPTSGFLIGSNDDQNWDVLKQYSGLTYTGSDYKATIVSESNKAYKYILLLIQTLDTNTGTYVFIEDFHIYGHRENDLVRLPDPTRVLKYPHIAMTGPAQRGYVASASTTYSLYEPWEAFNGVSDAGGNNYWSGANSLYSGTGTFNFTGSGDPYETIVSGTTYTGDWLQIELPHKIRVDHVLFDVVSVDRFPRQGVYAGSNDGSTWFELHTFSGLTTTVQETRVPSSGSFNGSSASNAYKYIRLIITHNNGGGYAGCDELKIFGTGVDSIPIQIGGGNIDKVANFRVYDKFVEEDQALEIWDAQKDVFREVKNAMTLHKGRLGLGTEEPEGRLAVLDEPHNLEEFPPRAMTGEETYMEGHGVFKASGNSNGSSVYRTFTKNSNLSWTTLVGGTAPGNPYSSSTGYTDTTRLTTGLSSEIPIAPYILLELPYKIKLSRYEWQTGENVTYHITAGIREVEIWAQNTGDTTWKLVNASSTVTPTTIFEVFSQTVNSSVYYDKYAFIALRTNGNVNGTIGELRYFGTREQGQSVLHDGQLTLTKSLNVPRIGPALDADDTPRRDRLVVEYNTSTNPTFEGAVRDTSGRGNDGVLYGGASYDVTEKALVFDGTVSDQFVHTLRNGRSESGNINYSVSLWFNPTTVNISRWRAVFAIGTLDRSSPDNDNDEISMYVKSGTNVLHVNNGGSTFDTTGTVTAGTWTHIVLTYDGTNRKIYLDGTLNVTNGYTTLNLPDEMLIRLAESIPSNGSDLDEYMDCKISNFKVWFGAALTAQEVKTLYDMGRNGSVANPQPLHIAAPLYAPGSIVQVQYASTPLNSTSRQEIVGGELSDAANDIDYLDMNFKPKFANSSILLTAMINTNATHVASFGFKEDGTVIRTQAENNNSTGSIATVYEGTSSTEYMVNVCIQVLIPANGTHTRRYNTAANSYWADSSYTLYINDRASDDMRCMSNMIVYEIAN